MKILILTNSYPPEIGGHANLCLELAQSLTNMGHSILVVTRFPLNLPRELSPSLRGKLLIKEKQPEAEVIRINVPQLSRGIPFVRELEHFLCLLFFIIACLINRGVDIIWTSSPPLEMSYAAVIAGFIKRIKVVLNVQDIFPQNLIDLGVLKNKYLISLSRFLERFIYQQVEWITVMSEGNKEIIDKISKRPEIVSVIPNWVDTDCIVPGEHNNGFRKEFGLVNKFILSFAGCMADSQDMEIILKSAKLLEDHKDILFLLAGNGPKYEHTVCKVKKADLNNVKIIPLQPRNRYVDFLAASDVGMVTLNTLVATPTVPSKIKSIMSASRPVLASFPLSGDAPKLIKEAKCGIVVQAGDTKAFCEAILKLFQNHHLCEEYGKNGREYAVKNFSVRRSAQKYEDLFRALTTKNR
jgi:glycosyltransferase involved in cell wall biosynthesis